MKDKVLIGLAVALVVLIAVTFFGGKMGPQGPAGRDGASVGSVAGPDNSFEITSQNGVARGAASMDFRQATGTVCGLKSPASTSTLQYISFSQNTATATAALIRIATSTTDWATTTLAYTFASMANTNRYYKYSPTTTENAILAPNTYIVVDYNGNTGGYRVPGRCTMLTNPF